jgi:AcrR family transcriptional regulator
MRADARRNRELLLAVAEEVFATRGTSASTEEIARAAGVGIGTVFRHFPTKAALLEAVFIERMRRLSDDAVALAAADDPGTAFFTFFTRVVEHASTKNAIADALADTGVDMSEMIAMVRQDVYRAVDVLLTRAQQAGAVRDDIYAADLLALLIGASRAVEHAGPDREVQARTLAVILDGLRPAGGR